jgi:hypothetical protein
MDAAHACAKAGRYGDALLAYDAVLASHNTAENDDHHHPAAERQRLGHHNRAVALTKLGRKGEALIAAALAVEAGSRNVKSLHNVGVLLGDLGEYAEADAVFLECARLVDDTGIRLRYALARATCMLEMQHFAQCDAMLEEAASAAAMDAAGDAAGDVGLLFMECRRRQAVLGRHRARARRSDTTRPLVASVFASRGEHDTVHFTAWLATLRAHEDAPPVVPSVLAIEVPPAATPAAPATRMTAVLSSVAAASPQQWSPVRGPPAPIPSFHGVRRSYMYHPPDNGGVAPLALVAALCAPRQASPAPRPAVSVSLRSSISSGM